jgi:hypothetical protein
LDVAEENAFAALALEEPSSGGEDSLGAGARNGNLTELLVSASLESPEVATFFCFFPAALILRLSSGRSAATRNDTGCSEQTSLASIPTARKMVTNS